MTEFRLQHLSQGFEVACLLVFPFQQAVSTLRPGAVRYLPFIACCIAPASKHCAWQVTVAQYVSVRGTNIYLIIYLFIQQKWISVCSHSIFCLSYRWSLIL